MNAIIVCGSRDGAPFGEVERAMGDALRDLSALGSSFNHVVVGSNRGVDGRAFRWAVREEMVATIVPAQWKSGGHKEAEGPKRNRRMISLFRPDRVLAFPGGSGTEDMVSAAKAAHIQVWRWVEHSRWVLDEGAVRP